MKPCPHCGRQTLRTTTTRKPRNGRIVRYHQCTACRYRVKTVESLPEIKKIL